MISHALHHSSEHSVSKRSVYVHGGLIAQHTSTRRIDHAVDKVPRGRNVLLSVAIDADGFCYVYAHCDLFASCHNLALSLYDITSTEVYVMVG